MPYDPETGDWISDEGLQDLMYDQEYNPSSGTFQTVATGLGGGFQTDFDPDLSAEELSNMSGEDLDSLLKQYDLDPDKYSKYFAAFNPQEIESLHQAFKNVLYSESRRNELIILGKERVKNFSWDKCAKETLKVYRNLC